MVDVNSLVESSDEGDEWESQALREAIVQTSILRLRDEHSHTLFGSGQVRELGEYTSQVRPSVVFANHILTSLQQKRVARIWNKHIAVYT